MKEMRQSQKSFVLKTAMTRTIGSVQIPWSNATEPIILDLLIKVKPESKKLKQNPKGESPEIEIKLLEKLGT